MEKLRGYFKWIQLRSPMSKWSWKEFFNEVNQNLNDYHALENEVRVFHEKDASGHDWAHIARVIALSEKIRSSEEQGDLHTVYLIALLHDVLDEKLYTGGKEEAEQAFLSLLYKHKFSNEECVQLQKQIDSISFKGGHGIPPTTIEAKIVQDADRLDAIGAIGVARTFAYGGAKGHPMFAPQLPIRDNMTEAAYRTGKTSTLHHFFEKLFLLKDRMHTETAKELAQSRHDMMKQFVEAFIQEWTVDGSIFNKEQKTIEKMRQFIGSKYV